MVAFLIFLAIVVVVAVIYVAIYSFWMKLILFLVGVVLLMLHWLSKPSLTENDQQRLAEIRRIGEQARLDMEQLTQDYLQTVFNLTGGPQ